MASAYTAYYVNQAQTGQGMGYFAGLPSQKGYGIGSFLGGLFRTAFPFLKRGAQYLSKEALRAGSHVLADVAAGEPVKRSLKRHAGQAGRNIMVKTADTLRGNGIKRQKLKATRQSRRGRGRGQAKTFDILGR